MAQSAWERWYAKMFFPYWHNDSVSMEYFRTLFLFLWQNMFYILWCLFSGVLKVCIPHWLCYWSTFDKSWAWKIADYELYERFSQKWHLGFAFFFWYDINAVCGSAWLSREFENQRIWVIIKTVVMLFSTNTGPWCGSGSDLALLLRPEIQLIEKECPQYSLQLSLIP